MAFLRPRWWSLVLVHMLLVQLRVQAGAQLDLRTPAYQKLRRLDEQFQQFRAMTQARLDLLALNQNYSLSAGWESRVQFLADQYHKISKDVDGLKHTTAQEMEVLREWRRKLEKKSKRMEGRLEALEDTLRDSLRRHAQKQKPDGGLKRSNLTLELQGQEGRLAFLESQREELLGGLRELKTSLNKQEVRMSHLQRSVGEVLQGNIVEVTSRRSGRNRNPLTSNLTPQEGNDEPRSSRSQTLRGRRPEMSSNVPERKTQPRSQDDLHDRVHSYPVAPARQSRPQAEFHNSQAQGSRFQPWSSSQPQHQHPSPQQQQQQRHQPVAYSQAQIQHQTSQATSEYYPRPLHSYPRSLDHRDYQQQSHNLPPPQQRHAGDRQTRPRPKGQKPQQPQLYPNLKPLQPHGSDHHHAHHPQPEHYYPRLNEGRGEEEESAVKEVKTDAPVIQSFPRLPARHKIPAGQSVPKKEATICNVDSILFFPFASAENYVTFSRSFPALPELSVCLWLSVAAAGHVGTLLSYATDDNDNQLVLFGRNSSSSSTFLSSLSPSSHSTSYALPSSSPSSSLSSMTLDFVVGDPVYRRLPVGPLLDGDWHHLCLAWSSIQGRYWHYADQHLVSSGSNFRKGWEVPGGGSVVLGQEQDSVGGGFDPAEGFAGRVAGFRVWERVLSPEEVEGVAAGQGVPRGVVLGMEDIEEVHGEVNRVACECLELCV